MSETTLLGYVSDERYVAVPGAHVEVFQGANCVGCVESSASGAVRLPLEPGEYTVIISAGGHGAKQIRFRAPNDLPLQIRLLRDTLLGYAWPKWVKSGEKSEFHVHFHHAFRLSFARYGAEVEKAQLMGWFDEHGPEAMRQVLPDGDFTQRGVCWNQVGFGSPHHTQFATAPEKSGLYYFLAESERGEAFTFPWVVAPRQPSAPIAVIAATNTWNAYNNFGGRGNYINSTGLPVQPTVNARQDLARYRQAGSFNEWVAADDLYLPISFQRPEPGNQVRKGEIPTDPIRGRSECHLAPAEWRLLAWMEREGFEYDLYSEHHLHSGELDLDAYRVVVLPPHPEYWTRTMFDRLYDWVHLRGGRLAYLGGNGLNCEIEFLDPSTMRCHSHLPSSGGEMSFLGLDGKPLESRFHRRHVNEATLLGVVCTEAGIMTAAPYRVVDSTHWVFRGTGLRAGDLFGIQSLHERCPGGASGHETDKRSAYSPANTILLAKGTNPDEGGSEMITYETASGGMVFSAGSITYAASLLVDEPLSKITRNVIERLLA